jgi:hypothetical protein
VEVFSLRGRRPASSEWVEPGSEGGGVGGLWGASKAVGECGSVD